jgi:hypothetical protein
LIFCVFAGYLWILFDVCRGFLNFYEHFSKPFKSTSAQSVSRAKQNMEEKRYV